MKMQEEMDKEKAENVTLKTDGQRWRQRVNQLIEKHQKISPEELLKSQNENTLLRKQLHEKTNAENTWKRNNQVLTNRSKILEAELISKTQDKAKTDQENTALKNTNQQITGKYNLLAKQKQEVENSSKLLAAEKENLSSEVQKHKNETAALNR